MTVRTRDMRQGDFSIGLQFYCDGKRWRCTDIGTRVIVAISLEPREMVRVEVDSADKTRRTETRFTSDDPRDLNGPPYGVVESVFDENDMVACTVTPETED